MVEKPWNGELEATGNIVSAGVKQKEMNTGTQHTFSFLFSTMR